MLSHEQSEALKKGPLRGVFAQLRRWKRRLRGEPLTGEYVAPIVPMTVQDLLPLGPEMVDEARFFYSLGRGWLEQETDEASARALACLRCADALRFEGVERTRLFRALAMARLGNSSPVIRNIESLASHELLPAEAELREAILSGTILVWAASTDEREAGDAEQQMQLAGLRQQVETAAPERLLVLGDATAATAHWLPTSLYYCAATAVNGLSACDLTSLPLEFDLGLAPATEIQEARRAGVRCKEWIATDKEQNSNLVSADVKQGAM